MGYLSNNMVHTVLINDITVEKLRICLQDRGTGCEIHSLASEMRSLCYTHQNSAVPTLVSQFCHFINCWAVILLWGDASTAKYLLEGAVLSLHTVLRGRFSSVHPLVRFMPWWGLCATSSCCVQDSSPALLLVCFRAMSLFFLTQCSRVPRRQHWGCLLGGCW